MIWQLVRLSPCETAGPGNPGPTRTDTAKLLGSAGKCIDFNAFSSSRDIPQDDWSIYALPRRDAEDRDDLARGDLAEGKRGDPMVYKGSMV